MQFVEVLGRNAGWIVAATALARRRPEDAPHLVYFPERPLPLDRLLGDVERVYGRLGRCVVAVCEGQLDEHGQPFGADVRGNARGSLAMNLAHRLATLVTARLKLKARGEKPGLLGRVNRAARSPVDWKEARLCGRAAVRAAARGVSGAMVTLVRQAGPGYRVTRGSPHSNASRERSGSFRSGGSIKKLATRIRNSWSTWRHWWAKSRLTRTSDRRAGYPPDWRRVLMGPR